MRNAGKEAAAVIRDRAGSDYCIGIVLGSGLGSLANDIEDAIRIPYGELASFPAAGVSSHACEVVAGGLAGMPVILLSGRAHYYESGDAAAMRAPIEALAELGCETILLTNSAGSLRDDLPPGELMLLSDHINYSGLNPLIGEDGDDRFVDMSRAYDPALADRVRTVSQRSGHAIRDGVYMWFSGPSFETPAEVRMARRLGADAVGMSTVPEVIIARFIGLRVGAISTITNFAAGMTEQALSHEQTKNVAAKSGQRLRALVRDLVEDLAHE